jgi:hypothetical protein
MSNSGSLRSYLASRTASNMDCERVKREAWREEGDAVLMHDQIAELPLDDRRHIERIISKIYGFRKVKG